MLTEPKAVFGDTRMITTDDTAFVLFSRISGALELFHGGTRYFLDSIEYDPFQQHTSFPPHT